MTRREKFQDSNALIQISRQLKAAAKLPAASAQEGLTSLRNKHETAVAVDGEAPSSLQPERLVLTNSSSPATQQTYRKGKRPAACQLTGDTSLDNKSHSGKARKLTPTVDMKKSHHSNDLKTQPLGETHHASQAANSQQVAASVRTTDAAATLSHQFSAWYTSTYTQVFAEELAAMREGQDMSQSQLKLLSRVLHLGSSSFGIQHHSVLSQVAQSAGQCTVEGHVSAWL